TPVDAERRRPETTERAGVVLRDIPVELLQVRPVIGHRRQSAYRPRGVFRGVLVAVLVAVLLAVFRAERAAGAACLAVGVAVLGFIGRETMTWSCSMKNGPVGEVLTMTRLPS